MFDDAGLVNKLLDAVGVGGVDWLQNRWLALLPHDSHSLKNIGFNAILYLTAMQAPVSVYEAAQLTGLGNGRASRGSQFRSCGP